MSKKFKTHTFNKLDYTIPEDLENMYPNHVVYPSNLLINCNDGLSNGFLDERGCCEFLKTATSNKVIYVVVPTRDRPILYTIAGTIYNYIVAHSNTDYSMRRWAKLLRTVFNLRIETLTLKESTKVLSDINVIDVDSYQTPNGRKFSFIKNRLPRVYKIDYSTYNRGSYMCLIALQALRCGRDIQQYIPGQSKRFPAFSFYNLLVKKYNYSKYYALRFIMANGGIGISAGWFSSSPKSEHEIDSILKDGIPSGYLPALMSLFSSSESVHGRIANHVRNWSLVYRALRATTQDKYIKAYTKINELATANTLNRASILKLYNELAISHNIPQS